MYVSNAVVSYWLLLFHKNHRKNETLKHFDCEINDFDIQLFGLLIENTNETTVAFSHHVYSKLLPVQRKNKQCGVSLIKFFEQDWLLLYPVYISFLFLFFAINLWQSWA